MNRNTFFICWFSVQVLDHHNKLKVDSPLTGRGIKKKKPICVKHEGKMKKLTNLLV